jgi:hypothetical protein
LKVPVAVGVPLIVIVLAAQVAVTPAGKFVALPMPVAIVVVCVISVIAASNVSVGVDDAVPTAQIASTVIVPVAFTLLQLVPVIGIV